MYLYLFYNIAGTDNNYSGPDCQSGMFSMQWQCLQKPVHGRYCVRVPHRQRPGHHRSLYSWQPR